jgi:glycosyltransferase involved in cell wall biosynthesis
MKVLMVNKFLYPKGGSETYMFALADYFTKMGHEVRFFGMYDEKNMVNVKREYLVNHIDFYEKSLKKFFYPFKIIYSREAKEKIGTIIREFKPDIVHLNNYNYQLTPSILYEIEKNGIPVVQTVHDPNLICPFHRLYNYQRQEICEKCKGKKFINCLKTKCINGSFSRSLIGTIEAYLYSYLDVYKKLSYFICPSHFMANKLVEFGIDKNRVRVLHNFIGELPENTEFSKKDYILYFGRLSQEKGISTFLRAINELKDIKFVFAGGGPLETELNKYPNIKYVGFKQGKELTKVIQKSLFTVYPSEWYENCPMSVLESQALGIPVIGAKIGGIPELIEDGVDGLLFQPGNDLDLLEKIKYLYNNRDILNQFSFKCREKVRRFSIDLYYDKIMNIYNEAIHRKEGR